MSALAVLYSVKRINHWLKRGIILCGAILIVAFVHTIVTSTGEEIRHNLSSTPYFSSRPFSQPLTGNLLRTSLSPSSILFPPASHLLRFHGMETTDSLSICYLSTKGGRNYHSCHLQMPYFIQMEQRDNEFFYALSSDNLPTSFWMKISQATASSITVSLFWQNGNQILESEEETIPLWTNPLFYDEGGTVEGVAVDEKLKDVQKMVWLENDQFLQDHPSKQVKQGRVRIGFSSSQGDYSRFVSHETKLIWFSDRWISVPQAFLHNDYPTLLFHRIYPHQLRLHLWSPQQQVMHDLALERSIEEWSWKELVNSWKFVGVKAWDRATVEINDEKFYLISNDWLLHTENGWRSLRSRKEIEQYVSGEITGELFILDKVQKEGLQFSLLGQLYSPQRTQKQMVKLVLQSSPQKEKA